MNFNLNSRAFYDKYKAADLESIKHDESFEFYTRNVWAVHSKSGKYRLIYSSGGLENPVLDTSGNEIEVTREQLLTDIAIAPDGTSSRTLNDERELNNNRNTGVSRVFHQGRDATNRFLIETGEDVKDKFITTSKKALDKMQTHATSAFAQQGLVIQGSKELLEVIEPIAEMPLEELKETYGFTESEARRFLTASQNLHAKLANIKHIGKKPEYKKLLDDIADLVKQTQRASKKVPMRDANAERIDTGRIPDPRTPPKPSTPSTQAEPANSETATAITKLNKSMKNKIVDGVIKKAEGGSVSHVRKEGPFVHKLWDEIKDEFKKNPSDEVLKALFNKYGLSYRSAKDK